MAGLTNWVEVGLTISRGLWGTTSSAGAASQLMTESVCLPCTSRAIPQPGMFSGRGITLAPYREAILLVHGASTRGIWDFREDLSVARNLARAGYVVIAYDQLGFGDSHHERPEGERTLTLEGPGHAP